jgi:hypothetical protein
MNFYETARRPMRMCHARDLITQVENYSTYHKVPAVLTEKNLDLAITNYFAVM